MPYYLHFNTEILNDNEVCKGEAVVTIPLT